MRNLRYALILAAACCPLAMAQVYESVDEQGNPVYSDKPSPGGQAVEISEPNRADSVEVPPTPEPVIEAQPEIKAQPKIEADPEPSGVEGEMIGEKRKKGKKKKILIKPRSEVY